MNTFFQAPDGADNLIDNRRLISGLRQALDLHYARLLDAAKNEWERKYAGKDPSDACVSVRIGSGDSQELSLPCAGVLRNRGRSVLSGSRRGLLASVRAAD
jgi:hypothetical protein